MAWFKKPRRPMTAPTEPSRVPEGLWVKCPGCSQTLYQKELTANLNVCPHCAHHFRLDAAARLRSLLDDSVWKEHDAGLVSNDPLNFTDRKPYTARLQEGMAATGLRDAVITATGAIERLAVEIVAMEYGFIGGSMGVVVGEKITRAVERSIARRHPLIIICCSGGARMMEGTLSLMQMAKISVALARLDRAHVPYVAVLTDPTTGGVTASFAMLADISIGEPGALIGFAGPRVIEQTIRHKLPAGFQRSEFLLERGMLDMVVDRRELRPTLVRTLSFMGAAAPAAGPIDHDPVLRPAAPDTAPPSELTLD
jgi:acetyl-CoA carboxylase carboxyl transferase subunit beta